MHFPALLNYKSDITLNPTEKYFMNSRSNKLPETKAYYLCAMGHSNAATIIHDYLKKNNLNNTDSTWLALQNIIGLAAENALKSYLSSRGVSRTELRNRKFGHDLKKLLEKSVELGLDADGNAKSQADLVPELNSYITLCGNDYNSFNYRYLERESLQVLSSGLATSTVITAIQCVLEIVDGRATS